MPEDDDRPGFQVILLDQCANELCQFHGEGRATNVRFVATIELLEQNAIATARFCSWRCYQNYVALHQPPA